MKSPRFVGMIGFGAYLLGAAFTAPAYAAQNSPHSSAPSSTATPPTQIAASRAPAILPQAFGGWQMQGSAKASTDAAIADPANAEVLKEYRFTDFASATYASEDGRTLKIRAARFADASGAFGAYTFYLQPEMTKEDIGDQAASLGKRVLFYRGHILVDASFSEQNAMSAAQLRELAGDLPRPGGSAANLPSFIEYMPRRDYIANTKKYVMGPAALNAVAAPLPPSLVDFGVSSEVTLARYDTPSGEATLTLISYPTNQLAADHLRRIDAAHQLAQPQAGVAMIEGAGSFHDKRTGPIVAIVTGPVSDSDAKTLLGRVNYEATVTWNTPAENTQVRDLYMLILNIVVLCAILAGLAIVAGIAFGGFRILMKRWYPDRVFDRPEQMEFISLRLTEVVIEEASPSRSEVTPKAPQKPA
ncbi:MAG TPA: DUF6599 family protein [Terriglobales bacterium]|nr:DUF6599 family protein [Terriglobales bacterium]